MNEKITLKRLVEQQEFYYDLGKDFQAFERTVDVTTEQAKEKFQKAMGSKILGNKVVVRASRGYKQPEKDYTINKVSSINIDWYYTQYVVTIKDESDKEYFLKPGFKIKVVGAPKGEKIPQTSQAPQEPTKAPEVPGVPEKDVPAPKMSDKPAAPGSDRLGKAGGKPVPPPPRPPLEETLNEETDRDDALHYYGTKLTKEINKDYAQRYLDEFFPQGFDVRPYIVSARSSDTDEDGGWYSKFILQIPKNKLSKDFDADDFELEVKSGARYSGGPGQPYSSGYVNIEEAGSTLVFTFYFSGGLDI